MTKLEIVKELLKDLNNRELREISHLILDREVDGKENSYSGKCQICKEHDYALQEGISGLRQCYGCWEKIWRSETK